MNKLFKLAEEFTKKLADLVPGGLADHMSPSDFDQDALRRGVEEEMKEHTSNPALALEIVMDHLSKDPNHYG
jgi:hypothetical protein